MLKQDNKYGLIKGRLVGGKKQELTSHEQTPHYMLYIQANDFIYQAPVNVYSRKEPHNLKYKIHQQSDNPILKNVISKEDGVHNNLKIGLNGESLDYLRDGIFNINTMKVVTEQGEVGVTELEDCIEEHLHNSMNDHNIKVCIFGELFFNRHNEVIGIHDIHMNQGNSKQFQSENGIWQDGGLIIFNEKEQQVICSLFFAFQSQCTKTDDKTGACVS